MKKYLISRGYYKVDVIWIDADSEEVAIEQAKAAPEQHYKDVTDDDVLYQVEEVRP